MLAFDSTVNLGQVITLTGFLAGGIIFATTVRNRLAVVEQTVKTMSEKLEIITTLMTQLARQDERINSLTRSVEDIRHGKGFIFDEWRFSKQRQDEQN